MDQRRTFPVYTTTTTLLSGNSQYGKRAGVLLQEKKTSRTRRYPATPHTYTVQSFFATSQFDCFSLALLCIFHHSFIKITNVCKWVLDIPTTPLTEAKIAGSPLPIASHRIVADNVYEYLEKKKNVKRAIRGQNSHPTSLEFEI